jgi:hypothetical protein
VQKSFLEIPSSSRLNPQPLDQNLIIAYFDDLKKEMRKNQMATNMRLDSMDNRLNSIDEIKANILNPKSE